jgi:nicotinamidase/pyrazinamidase
MKGENMRHALILVDLQPDFMPGGALAVPEGDAVVEPALRHINSGTYDLIVATQDWHPNGHQSFASAHTGGEIGALMELHGLPQVLWPDHCVEDTPGARLHEALPLNRIDRVFKKGTNPTVDSYSGFYDNGRRHSTGLAEYLRLKGVSKVTVLGLATDYCVKWTALDAASEGFSVRLDTAACRGVNLSPGDVDKALAELTDAGVELM